jgi:hypothetical protein
VEAERFVVGIWFPDDYLRAADPFTVLTWLEPRAAFHPNIRAPFMCIGRSRRVRSSRTCSSDATR